MTANPMPPPKRARLYAMLLAREYWQRCSILYGNAAVGQEYAAFLRANRRHGDKLCPYGAAIRMIEGRA